jgi:hypothetical protein
MTNQHTTAREMLADGRMRSLPFILGIPLHHFNTELGKLVNVFRGARVVRLYAFAFRSKAKRNRYIKIFNRLHHFVEPSLGIGAQPVRPA